MIRKSRQGQAAQEARRRRSDQHAAASVVMYVEKVDQECEQAWQDAIGEMDLQEAFWTARSGRAKLERYGRREATASKGA